MKVSLWLLTWLHYVLMMLNRGAVLSFVLLGLSYFNKISSIVILVVSTLILNDLILAN